MLLYYYQSSQCLNTISSNQIPRLLGTVQPLFRNCVCERYKMTLKLVLLPATQKIPTVADLLKFGNKNTFKYYLFEYLLQFLY